MDKIGNIKIADFGLAGARNATLLTRTEDVFGTFHYSSPEQIMDSHNVDKRSDIYSFGAILYHVACGVLPLDADTWPDLVRRIRETVPPAPIELRSDIPKQLSQIIMKCLAKAREDRFNSFAEVGEYLSVTVLSNADSAGTANGALPVDLNTALDMAQREATISSSAFVEPVHLLLAAVLGKSEPIQTWLNRKRISEAVLCEQIRSLAGVKITDSTTDETRFKRSSRRVIGLAHAFAERDGSVNPTGRHLLRALARESAIREILEGALANVNGDVEEIEDLFDEIDGLFELLDMDGI